MKVMQLDFSTSHLQGQTKMANGLGTRAPTEYDVQGWTNGFFFGSTLMTWSSTVFGADQGFYGDRPRATGYEEPSICSDDGESNSCLKCGFFELVFIGNFFSYDMPPMARISDPGCGSHRNRFCAG